MAITSGCSTSTIVNHRLSRCVTTAAVVFISIILGGCNAAQLGEFREGIRQADDGLTAAQVGIDAALTALPPSHVAHGPLKRAKPYVDQAQPVVRNLRETADQSEDLPGLVKGIGQGYKSLGLPAVHCYRDGMSQAYLH